MPANCRVGLDASVRDPHAARTRLLDRAGRPAARLHEPMHAAGDAQDADACRGQSSTGLAPAHGARGPPVCRTPVRSSGKTHGIHPRLKHNRSLGAPVIFSQAGAGGADRLTSILRQELLDTGRPRTTCSSTVRVFASTAGKSSWVRYAPREKTLSRTTALISSV